MLGTSKVIEVIGEAFDGEDTIKKALKFKPDVVIMDLVMPRKDGIKAEAASIAQRKHLLKI